jgi:siroheme synthase
MKNHRVDLDWDALARPGQTVVIYMGVTGLDEISARLRTAGLPDDTPAALIHRATLPGQRAYPGTLRTLPEIARDKQLKPPALIVVGHVVSLLRNADDICGQCDGPGRFMIVKPTPVETPP